MNSNNNNRNSNNNKHNFRSMMMMTMQPDRAVTYPGATPPPEQERCIISNDSKGKSETYYHDEWNRDSNQNNYFDNRMCIDVPSPSKEDEKAKDDWGWQRPELTQPGPFYCVEDEPYLARIPNCDDDGALKRLLRRIEKVLEQRSLIVKSSSDSPIEASCRSVDGRVELDVSVYAGDGKSGSDEIMVVVSQRNVGGVEFTRCANAILEAAARSGDDEGDDSRNCRHHHHHQLPSLEASQTACRHLDAYCTFDNQDSNQHCTLDNQGSDSNQYSDDTNEGEFALGMVRSWLSSPSDARRGLELLAALTDLKQTIPAAALMAARAAVFGDPVVCGAILGLVVTGRWQFFGGDVDAAASQAAMVVFAQSLLILEECYCKSPGGPASIATEMSGLLERASQMTGGQLDLVRDVLLPRVAGPASAATYPSLLALSALLRLLPPPPLPPAAGIAAAGVVRRCAEQHGRHNAAIGMASTRFLNALNEQQQQQQAAC